MDNEAGAAAIDTAQPEVINAPEISQPAAETVEAPKFEPTPRGAVERAMAKLDGREPARTTTLPAERERDPATGQFKAKEAAPVVEQAAKPEAAEKPIVSSAEAPSRFSADAKAAWANTHPAVQAEAHRAIRELESGLTKYKADAEAWDAIRDFDQMAKDSGTTIRDAMTNYVGIEKLLRTDFVAGMDRVCQNMGVDLVEFAKHIVEHVTGEPGQDEQTPENKLIASLKAEIAELRGSVGNVTETFRRQANEATEAEVKKFAEGNSRFDELSGDIKKFLKSGELVPMDLPPMQRLAEAYKLAERLNPAPAAPVISAPEVKNPDPQVQTRRGSLSVTGAPGNGSDPAIRKPASSIRDSIRNARAAVG